MAKPNEEVIMWVLVIIAGIAVCVYQWKHTPKMLPPTAAQTKFAPVH